LGAAGVEKGNKKTNNRKMGRKFEKGAGMERLGAGCQGRISGFVTSNGAGGKRGSRRVGETPTSFLSSGRDAHTP
jgi:hypothetical protein